MNCYLIKSFFALVLFLFISLEQGMALETGQSLPKFNLKSLSGQTVDFSSYSGKLIYLDIWASWCGNCVKSLTWMEDLQKKFPNESFQVITISVDENINDVQKIISKLKSSLLVALDPEGIAPSKLDVGAIPTSYLVGPNGQVISIHSGLKDEDRHEIEDQIKRHLGQET